MKATTLEMQGKNCTQQLCNGGVYCMWVKKKWTQLKQAHDEKSVSSDEGTLFSLSLSFFISLLSFTRSLSLKIQFSPLIYVEVNYANKFYGMHMYSTKLRSQTHTHGCVHKNCFFSRITSMLPIVWNAVNKNIKPKPNSTTFTNDRSMLNQLI